ncbi:MAG: IS256 family transposase [Anaeroplasmataceae bacterium]
MAFDHLDDNIELLKKNLYKELDKDFKDTNISEWNISTYDKLFKSYVASLLKTEFELFITENKNNNYRNGYSYRTIKTVYGEVEVKVPRDRNGEFDTKILTKYSSSTEELSKIILTLFQLGLSHNDICIFIDNIYNVKYSRQSISTMTIVANEVVMEFKARDLSNKYIALFLDATYIPIRFDNKYELQGVHLVVGINEYGFQEIVSYSIGYRESIELWSEVLDDLKLRGVKEVDIIVTDGFVGINKVIKSRFPNAKIQRCTVHVLRNIMSKVTKEDLPSIIGDFSGLFKLTDRDSYENQLTYLRNKYKKYEMTLNKIFSDPNISTYLDFPQRMHRTIKTTNRIEAVNQKIKTRIKFKQNFPNVESFERTLVSSIIQQNNTSNKAIGGLTDYLTRKKMEN